jgi:SAM-dependent methyltransferase
MRDKDYMQQLVKNKLLRDTSSVWVIEGHDQFDYSDGAESERYLESVFKAAEDLSSGSVELEGFIKDWPSEYHLSTKRSQIFAGFNFDRGQKVLEVGAGCGAITRYLGETFDDVVSVEGSLSRARLARLRTRDLPNVEVLCAPFQEIEFSQKFDLIVCVGVYEYSSSFVQADDPYEAVLDYFDRILSPDGTVVVAIENQFGLKYLNGAREDHTGIVYDGVQGYCLQSRNVRTFGKLELEDKLAKRFGQVKTFYPYPDYKMPTLVISEEFLSSEAAGELVSQVNSRDYSGNERSNWNETLATLELSRNKALPFFANSFLVFASRVDSRKPRFEQCACMRSCERDSRFRTETRIYQDETGQLQVAKRLLSGQVEASRGKVTIRQSDSIWQASYSLHTQLYRNCYSQRMSLTEMFRPGLAWINALKQCSDTTDNQTMLDGQYIDCIFRNVYFDETGIRFVDQEWVWNEPIRLEILVIRALYFFLSSVERSATHSPELRGRSMRKTIKAIADSWGLVLTSTDFSKFVHIESEFQSLASNVPAKRVKIQLVWSLIDRPSLLASRKLRVFGRKAVRRLGLGNVRVKKQSSVMA